MRRNASSMSLVGPANDSRTNEPPRTVSKSMPGAIATPVSFNSFEQNDSESVVRCDTSAYDIERAVGGGQPVDADRAHPVQQQLPVRRIVMQQRIRLGDRFRCERRDGGHLRQHWRTDREVTRQAVHRPLQLLRHQQPAQSPSGHGEVLRKAVDHHGISRCLPRAAGLRSARVNQPVVDLVADQPDAFRLAPRSDRREFLGWNHRPGRVGGARHDHALHRRIQVGEHLGRRLEPGIRSAGHLDDLTAQRRQDVAVAGIAGAGDGHSVADVEARKERQQESTARPGGDHDLVGVDDEPVAFLVGACDRGTQLGDAQRHGVAENGVVQRVFRRCPHGRGSARARLARR